jgi:biopolymer transport protein TolR
MAFYYSRRKLRPAELEEAGELNIVPYLDILMNLIIFMLLSMTGLAAFGILNVSAPTYGGPTAGVTDTPETPKLLLTVLISKKGFYVAGAGGVLGAADPSADPAQAAPTVARRSDGEYDFKGLTAQMEKVKTAYPNETKVILGAEGDVAYEVLIHAMDAVRETGGSKSRLLFPDVTLATM